MSPSGGLALPAALRKQGLLFNTVSPVAHAGRPSTHNGLDGQAIVAIKLRPL